MEINSASRQNEETEKYVLNEAIKQNPEEELNKVKIGKLLNKVFKVMIIKLLKEVGRRIDEHIQKINSE